MQPDEVKASKILSNILDLIEEKIPFLDKEGKRIVNFNLDSIRPSLMCQEPYIAFEMLVSNLYEISFPMTREIYEEMKEFSLCFPTPPEDYKILSELIVDS